MRKKPRPIKNDLWTYRKKKGLSQKRVAFFLGHKTSSQLSNYERGAKIPGLLNALKLEIILGIPVAFIFRNIYHKLKGEIEARKGKLTALLEEEQDSEE